MTDEQLATPKAPSRASTVALDSVESPQPNMTSPAPTLPTPPRQTGCHEQAQYPRDALQHVITIEHGEDLRSKCAIHEHILCANSQYLRNMSSRAEGLRRGYEKCGYLLDSLESITMAGMTYEQYDEKKLTEELLPLLQAIESKYPFPDYQKGINKTIVATVEQQFTNKNLIQTADVPKNINSFRGLEMNTRLSLLDSEGLFEVAEETCAHLQRLKATEKQKAKTNATKAWAQGRLILRGASKTSISCFMEWAYQTILPSGAEQLYGLWGLAKRLRIDILAEECTNRLFQAASSAILNARSNGTSLAYLLRPTEEGAQDLQAPPDDFVRTVFRHVLGDENPPQRLSHLVIDALAKDMDSELWADIGSTVNQVFIRQLVGAMVAYREVKTEPSGDDADRQVKFEADHGPDNSMLDVVEAHRQPLPTD